MIRYPHLRPRQAHRQEYVLYLGISVNGNTPVGTVPVKVINDRYWISAAVLKQMWIPVPDGKTTG